MAVYRVPVEGSYRILRGGEFGASRSEYGFGPHTGLDLTAVSGTPVVAAAAGVVVHAGGLFDQHIGAGNHVHIAHPGGHETRYVHLLSKFVREGQDVAAGQRIGAVGATGVATGPHLHFEVLVNGRHVDPAPHIGLQGSGAVLPITGGAAAPDPRPLRVEVPSGAACPAGYHLLPHPTFGNTPGTDVCERPSNPVQEFTEDLPKILSAAALSVVTNVAVVGGSVILIYRGVMTMLRP